MNNIVEINYKTNNRYPQVIINGEELTRLATLSSYIYDDIFRWASIFFELIDGDLADSYRVSLTGLPYQASILRAAAEQSQYCKGVDFKSFVAEIPIADKYDFASRLQGKTSSISNCLTFRTNDTDYFSSYASKHLLVSMEGDSLYCLVNSEEAAEELGGKYCVILSDRNEIVKKKNNRHFFFVKEGTLPLALEYFLTYHLYLPVIEDVMSNMERYSLDKETYLEFEAYTEESYRVWAENLPDQLDEGAVYSWNYKVFPSCFPKDGIKVSSSNPDVITYTDGVLTAQKSGEATICITDSNGKEFFSQTLNVMHHIYATNITVIIPSTTLLVNSTMHFRTIVSPINAEDMDQITYQVSDERVAVLTSNDELYALSAGRVCLTVSTPRVSSKVYVNVPVQVCDVKLSTEESLALPIYAEATIYGSPYPANAVPLPDLVWKVEKGGKNVISIINSDNQKCVIRSNAPGCAILVCNLKDTTIEKRITVTVPQPKGCYIATAVYGSYDCPEVWVLRRYRDQYLDTRAFGRLFIKFYYAVSPTVVRLFGKSRFFNACWRKFLDRKVSRLHEKGYACSPYEDKNY